MQLYQNFGKIKVLDQRHVGHPCVDLPKISKRKKKNSKACSVSMLFSSAAQNSHIIIIFFQGNGNVNDFWNAEAKIKTLAESPQAHLVKIELKYLK